MVMDALLAASVGGLLWLDRYQLLQSMVSRPIVAASIIGWLLGDVSVGLAVGVLFEMLWLRQPPMGGYIPPDTTLASIACAAVASIVRARTGWTVTSAALISLLATLPVAYLGSRVDHVLRIILSAIAFDAERVQAQADERRLCLRFLAGLCVGFLLAFATLLVTIVPAAFLMTKVCLLLGKVSALALGKAFYVVPLVAAIDVMIGKDEISDVGLFLLGFAVMVIGSLILGPVGVG